MKGKKLVYELLLLVVLIFSLSGCTTLVGSGNVVSEARKVGQFDSIDVEGQADLYILQGDTQKLTMEADDNILPIIRTEVRNGTLYITQDDNYIDSSNPVKAYIVLQKINRISIKGSSRIVTKNKLHTDELTLSVSGSTNTDMDIDADSIYTNAFGSGKITLSGSAKVHEIQVKGSANVDAQDLLVDTCHIDVSGSSNCRVNVANRLDVDISGSSKVIYTGSPKDLNTSISGSGSLQKL